ncbi:hypothetical protein [Rheinheimera sp. 4Y26]|uniref:hypothetical protein n=1 Tax=Rheinheimera sp. 4Y26 TaxID=2977811 RepID=UPI0021B0C66E|nr:hypothetical protein [Rheinheimera sp. 4Y26]MCT6700929.1 hypothetical protein [Rheinheimera sp. 4Y26]
MTIATTNLKAQVQARIDAATGATSLKDLAAIRMAAEGLGCNESNTDTLIAAKLAAMNGETLLKDMLLGRKASELPQGTVLYSAPFDVSAGDDIYIDVLGKLKKKQHPVKMAVVASGVNQYLNSSSSFRTYLNTHRGGQPGGSTDLWCFSYTLQDGNIMFGALTGSASTNALCHTFIVNPTDMAVLSYQAVNISYGSGNSSNFRGVGLREVSANTFRLYFAAASSGESNPVSITFNTLTYNPATKAVTTAAGTTIQTSPGGAFDSVSNKQGDRYVLMHTSIYTYCLDMQNGTVNTYSGISGVTGLSQVVQFDVDSVGYEYALVLVGATPKLLKAGVDSVLDIPANLAADGCVGTGWVKTRIGAGAYITRNQTTKVMKLVKFSADYTTCVIYTLSSNYEGTNASNNGEAVYKKGDRYWFIPNNLATSAVSFLWDGVNAPTGFMVSPNVSPWDAPYLGGRGKVVASSADTLVNMAGVITSNSGGVLAYGAYIQLCDAAESFSTRATKVGTAITDADANNLFELQLNAKTTFVTSSLTTDPERISHGGLVTKLEKCRPQKVELMNESSAALSQSNIGDAIDCSTALSTSGIQNISFGKGALVLNEADTETTWRVTFETGPTQGGISATHLNGYRQTVGSTTALVAARINSPKPVLVSTYGATVLTGETPV